MYKLLLTTLAISASLTGMAQKNTRPTTAVPAKAGISTEDSLQIREWFFSGLREKVIQNNQLAAEFFQKIVTAAPAHDAALYELAAIYHGQNMEKEAEALVQKAVQVKPKNTWYWLLLADVYKKTNNLPKLTGVFDQLIQLSPDVEDYYYDKANALLLQNKTDEALAIYAAVEKKFGADEDLIAARQQVYQKQGKSGQAASELEKLVQSSPNDARNYLELGQVYLNSGNKDKALEVLLKAKGVDPGNPMVSLLLADVYRTTGKPDDAYLQLKQAFGSPAMNIDAKVRILLSFFPTLNDAKLRSQAEDLGATLVKVHPSEPKAFSVYGDLLFQEQKLNEARTAYKKALTLDSQVYLIWEQVIRIELSQSDFDAAIADGEEALSFFPNQAALYLYTGMAYAQKQNHTKVLSYLKNALSLESDDKKFISQVYSGLGDAYNALKNYPESNQAYEKSLAADPTSAYTLNNYAWYLAVRGENLEKAEQLSKRSLGLEKDNSSFEDTYAWILFKQKKFKEARVWMEKAIKDDQLSKGSLAEHYGDILFHLGEKELAVQQWSLAKTKGIQSEKLEKKINEKRYIE